MSRCTYVVTDAMSGLRALPDGCVNAVITSPPYLAKRAYLPDDHPDKAAEIGQEATPAAFLSALLGVTDELWRVLADDGTIWVNLGDTAAFSGGSGGDYNAGGLREGQAAYEGSAAKAQQTKRWARDKSGWPKAKSVCWVPELFGASLAYGRNLLTGEPCRQWITRPPVTWCKPNPSVGEIIDKFREATELVVWASKQGRYYFDLDAVREPAKYGVEDQQRPTLAKEYAPPGQPARKTRAVGATGRINSNPNGAPPLNWWEIPPGGYSGAHFAVYPPELIRRPVIAACPPGGLILDPFGGSGTTGLVATGNGRDALLFDLDARNVHLARERVGMFLVEASLDGVVSLFGDAA